MKMLGIEFGIEVSSTLTVDQVEKLQHKFEPRNSEASIDTIIPKTYA